RHTLVARADVASGLGGLSVTAANMKLRRKLLLAVTATLLAVLLIEAATAAWLHWLASDANFRTFASISQLRDRYGAFDRFEAHRHLGYALAPNYEKPPNRHNSLGFRGDELADRSADIPRIAFVGGSTTYGEGVPDYHMSVPQLIELGMQHEGKQVQSINAGCPGWTSLETLLNFQMRLLDLEPDYLVFYHGINDVLPRMVWPTSAFRGDLSGWLCRTERLAEAPLLERSNLCRSLLVATGSIEPHGSLLRVIGDVPSSSHTFAFRAQRMANTYPSDVFQDVAVDQMLRENGCRYFRRNLESLLALAKAHGVRPVLVTFAYSRDFRDRPYIGHPAVQQAIDAMNEVVRELGQRDEVDLIDIAPHLTAKDLFTDGVHFSAKGNVQRGLLLLPYFRERI
ncbi:MAG: lysophospholipase L1-like esterase, partial [Hyphomicrobiaceae bacterium]